LQDDIRNPESLTVIVENSGKPTGLEEFLAAKDSSPVDYFLER
jgi:hypothetical protein